MASTNVNGIQHGNLQKDLFKGLLLHMSEDMCKKHKTKLEQCGATVDKLLAHGKDKLPAMPKYPTTRFPEQLTFIILGDEEASGGNLRENHKFLLPVSFSWLKDSVESERCLDPTVYALPNLAFVEGKLSDALKEYAKPKNPNSKRVSIHESWKDEKAGKKKRPAVKPTSWPSTNARKKTKEASSSSSSSIPKLRETAKLEETGKMERSTSKAVEKEMKQAEKKSKSELTSPKRQRNQLIAKVNVKVKKDAELGALTQEAKPEEAKESERNESKESDDKAAIKRKETVEHTSGSRGNKRKRTRSDSFDVEKENRKRKKKDEQRPWSNAHDSVLKAICALQEKGDRAMAYKLFTVLRKDNDECRARLSQLEKGDKWVDF